MSIGGVPIDENGMRDFEQLLRNDVCLLVIGDLVLHRGDKVSAIYTSDVRYL